MQTARQPAAPVYLGAAPVRGFVQFSVASSPVCLLSMEIAKGVLVYPWQRHGREETPPRAPATATLCAETLLLVWATELQRILEAYAYV